MKDQQKAGFDVDCDPARLPVMMRQTGLSLTELRSCSDEELAEIIGFAEGVALGDRVRNA